jgi:nucleoside-diphosphate-sugar epimerase
MTLQYFLLLFNLVLLLDALQPVALITGATGRTGKLVTNLLLEKGFDVCMYCRDEVAARQSFHNPNIDFFQGDITKKKDIEAAYSRKQFTHVIFMAGGDGADYRTVNYHGVASFAQQATQCDTIEHFVVISTAWATKPYSIASILFNSLYTDSVPMASHYLGEEALRKVSSDTNGRLNYVILRAGGLNTDENYAKKYPNAVGMGLTYQQGDSFDFMGIAGRPGMARSQLAHAVVSALNVEGRYTVEVTGNGTVALDDSKIYQDFVQDNSVVISPTSQEEEIIRLHIDAVDQFKKTVIAASLGGIALVVVFGWFQGLFLLFSMDTILLIVWSIFFANRQATSG